VKAAVLHEIGSSTLEVRDDFRSADLAPGKVRIKIKATGVCHSDLSAMNGTIPAPVPVVLGHEGAGEIVEVASDVTELAVGDHVIVCWSPQCGHCRDCVVGQPYLCSTYVMQAFMDPPFYLGDTPVFGMAGTGTFAEELVIPVAGAIKIGDDVPYDVASLVGCGVMTGVGAVFNAGQVEPGTNVAIIGCGGVGISAIQGAKIAGAATIVAVDTVDQKLDWAKQFGATHAVKPEDLQPTMGLLTAGQGFDYVFDIVGHPTTIRQSYDNTRRGGKTVIVGVGKADQKVEFSPFELFYGEKTLRGTYYGSANIKRDFPRLLNLWRAGKLDLEGMITKRIELEGINDAFTAMQAGDVIRQVVLFD
jgi:S-(hydroxymethyl)glutathione dehydrogenase/alcohol dehydrogenase